MGLYDAAYEFVVNARVVIRKQDAEALAHLLRHRLGFHLLGVARCHGEFALDSHNFEAVGRAHHIPERGFAGGGGDADA